MEKDTKITKEKLLESFYAALMPAGIVLAVLLLVWIPFKAIPYMVGNGTNFVSTTLSSMLVSDVEKSSKEANDANENTTNATENKTVSSPVQKKYSGYPDFEITLISTGILDPTTKQFIPTNYVGFNDEIAIRFQVKNIGTNVTGAWRLRINTPSRTTPYYDSEDQVSIKPGDRIIFTTTFDSPITTGVNNAYITADPLNMIEEVSESNNLLTVPIKIEGTSYNYNYNYGSNPSITLPYGTLYSWSNLSVNCYAYPQTSYVGSPVTWYAVVSGGNGYYSYSWTGSDPSNPFYSNQNSVTTTYSSPGTKIATVTVNNNGSILTKSCSTFVY